MRERASSVKFEIDSAYDDAFEAISEARYAKRYGLSTKDYFLQRVRCKRAYIKLLRAELKELGL